MIINGIQNIYKQSKDAVKFTKIGFIILFQCKILNLKSLFISSIQLYKNLKIEFEGLYAITKNKMQHNNVRLLVSNK